MSKKVGGVIVTYNPDIQHFERVLSAAFEELELVVVVNNGNKPLELSFDFVQKDGLTIIENHFNKGIASALNIGLKKLAEIGYEYFLMLDQDSVLIKGTVLTLSNSLKYLISQGQKVAAVGPSYFNNMLNIYAPFIKYGRLRLRKLFIQGSSSDLVETHLLITSGTLITLEAIRNVGLMQDELFIDYVDTEWCLRALSKGYKIYGCFGAKLTHNLGDVPLNFWGLKFPMHSPLRHYYLSRNAILLAKKNYISLNTRFIILYRMLAFFIFYSLMPSNRLDHFKMMCRGIYDGIVGTSGPYTRTSN